MQLRAGGGLIERKFSWSKSLITCYNHTGRTFEKWAWKIAGSKIYYSSMYSYPLDIKLMCQVNKLRICLDACDLMELPRQVMLMKSSNPLDLYLLKQVPSPSDYGVCPLRQLRREVVEWFWIGILEPAVQLLQRGDHYWANIMLVNRCKARSQCGIQIWYTDREQQCMVTSIRRTNMKIRMQVRECYLAPSHSNATFVSIKHFQISACCQDGACFK